jgi:hypothetical protein
MGLGFVVLAESSTEYEPTNQQHAGIGMTLHIMHNNPPDDHTHGCGLFPIFN